MRGEDRGRETDSEIYRERGRERERERGREREREREILDRHKTKQTTCMTYVERLNLLRPLLCG